MFDLSKIFNLSKKFALPDTLPKSINYCSNINSIGLAQNYRRKNIYFCCPSIATSTLPIWHTITGNKVTLLLLHQHSCCPYDNINFVTHYATLNTTESLFSLVYQIPALLLIFLFPAKKVPVYLFPFLSKQSYFLPIEFHLAMQVCVHNESMYVASFST